MMVKRLVCNLLLVVTSQPVGPRRFSVVFNVSLTPQPVMFILCTGSEISYLCVYICAQLFDK